MTTRYPLPEEDLTFAKLGCRGVLALCARAAYYQFCERASVPFLRAYKVGYWLLFNGVIRWLPSMWGHERMYDSLRLLDDHCPTWLLTFIHDVTYGDYARRGRLAREAAEQAQTQQEA